MTSTSAVDDDLTIVDVEGIPLSVMVEGGMMISLGRQVKRDACLVKVTTKNGVVGWGEAHHATASNIPATIVNTLLKPAVIGMNAAEVVNVWNSIYHYQLKGVGTGTAAVMALSGLDMALWDVRGKAVGWPVYKLLGGARRSFKSYAGGIALGWKDPTALAEEARELVGKGFQALKLRMGDTPERDIARITRVRTEVGDAISLMVDANTLYTLDFARKTVPVFDELGVVWLEEPFAADDVRGYKEIRRLGTVALAAGESHFTRYAFARLVEEGDVTYLQPDLSKAGGFTEGMRIAAIAAGHNLSISPHMSMTGLDVAAALHYMAAIDNAGWFEADASATNPFRDSLVRGTPELLADGGFAPPDTPGLGVDVDEEFIKAHPFIEGPIYQRR